MDTYDPHTVKINQYKDDIKRELKIKNDLNKTINNIRNDIWLNNSERFVLTQYTITISISVEIRIFNEQTPNPQPYIGPQLKMND